MEDEKGLDLSLGLPCGGNSSAPKVIHAGYSEARSAEDDRGSKLISEFKNFLEGGNQHSIKVGENFYNQYAKTASDIEASKKFNTGAIWLTSECRSTKVEDGARSGAGEKRKNLFTETEHKKKHETETKCGDLTDKIKMSHISINTDEGSTAENEDTADSEVDGHGSTSKNMLHNNDISKQYMASGSVYRSQKDVFGDSESIEILGHNRHSVPSEKEINMTTMAVPDDASFPARPINMNASYSQSVKDLKSTTCLPIYPFPSVVPGAGASNVEKPKIPAVFHANIPLIFGYSSGQLPALDRDNSWGSIPHNQQIDLSFSGRSPVNDITQAPTPVVPNKSPEPTQYDSRSLEHGKSIGKQHVGEEGSSLHMKGDERDPSDESGTEVMPSEVLAIRPGISADLKFGGCGSHPNLPWVSTTGPDPNGRAISGVTYRFSPTHIKIVCACHGSHMSPEEFVRHASEENIAPPDAATGLASLRSSNPAASAQS